MASISTDGTTSVRGRSSIEIAPMSVHIGAEITGIDITAPLDDEQYAAVEAALHRWKVVFFRDQALDHDAHVRFARRFGKPTPGHVVFGGEASHPEVYSIAKRRTANSGTGPPLLRSWTGWHTDITAAINPPSVSILRADIVPPFGGDTQWTNLAVAYDKLSSTLRTFIDGLRTIHRFAPAAGAKASERYRDSVDRNTLVSEHPLVTVHPDTGERVLYVSPGFVRQVVGLAPSESEALLELLWEHAVRPEFTVRFRWEPGSVAMWDNRATAHLAPRDIFDTDFDRQFWRVTLLGEVPTGVDGRSSNPIEGAAITPT